MTIQNAPPGLDYDRDKKFSKVLVLFLGIDSYVMQDLVLTKTCSAVPSPLETW